MFLDHRIAMIDLDLESGSRKPKEHDAGMGEALVEDQLAEIAVGNQQNPLLLAGDGKDILISQTMRVIARDGRNVVAELAKVGNQSKISALVEQEFHTSEASEAAPFGGFGETSSPVTIAFISKACLHVSARQIRMGRQKLRNVRIVGELLQHQAHGNAGSPHHGLASQDPWIGSNAVSEETRIFFHINQLYHTEANSLQPLPPTILNRQRKPG